MSNPFTLQGENVAIRSRYYAKPDETPPQPSPNRCFAGQRPGDPLCDIAFPPANRWKTLELSPFFHWPEGTGTTDKRAEKGVLSIHKVLRHV
ncbi:MAG: hypothetical protein D4R88_06385 [Methanosarcinales archaeon]|nr:MAG: hypothetical protein D4R88_06385 [Methanosarcinales archaeon]